MLSETRSGPKRHVIPQHYLKGFSDPKASRHIWVYTKGMPYSTGNEVHSRRNPVKLAIRDAGARRDAYKMETLAGVSIDVDSEITRQETLGVPVLQKLRNREPISLEEKVRFSMYIDLMRRRVPARDAVAISHVRKAMEGYGWGLLRHLAAADGRLELAGRFDPRRPESVGRVEQELLLRGVARPSSTITQQIASMRWQFFGLDDYRGFPTTDNPALFPPNLGLTKGTGFVLLPIDSKMALFISNQAGPDCDYWIATTEQYELLRNVTLAGATQHAYADRNDPHILELMMHPQLPRSSKREYPARREAPNEQA